jgi:ubiquinone/menaquinone biosynthesis C-methylase UbiE
MSSPLAAVFPGESGSSGKTGRNLCKKVNLYQLAAALLSVAILLFSAVAPAAESEIDHLVQILQLKPGSSVADVGAGSGELSIAIAKRVEPYGKVYSTEINRQLLDKIRSSAEKARTQNVIIVVGKEYNTGLPPNCCDAIFLREVYHHLTNPIAIDHSLYQAMRPGARLAIIDFEPIRGQPAPSGVPANRQGHGVPKTIVAEELTRAGLELVKTTGWPISSIIEHYCMLFRKPFPRGRSIEGGVGAPRRDHPQDLNLPLRAQLCPTTANFLATNQYVGRPRTMPPFSTTIMAMIAPTSSG